MHVYIFVFYIICLLMYFHIKIFVGVQQKVSTCVPREHKPFWNLSPLDDFTINAIANLFVHERLKIPEANSELSQTSKIELFADLIYG